MTACLQLLLSLVLVPALGAPKALSAIPAQPYDIEDARLPQALWLEARPGWLDDVSRGWILRAEPWRADAEFIEIEVHVATGSVADVLDALTRADATYIWSDEGGVVNFLPREGTWGLVIRDILEMPIGDFRLEGATLEEGLGVLIKRGRSAGVQSFAVKPEEGTPPEPNGPKGPLVSVQVEQATIRSGLNALARAAAPAEWVAYATEEGLVLRVYALPKRGKDGRVVPDEAFPDLSASIRELYGRQARMGLAPFENRELNWQVNLLRRLSFRGKGTLR